MFQKRLCPFIALSLLCLAAGFMGCDNGNGPSLAAKPIEIVSPKGGESYAVGQTVVIRWKVNDTAKIASVGIRLSLDTGKTFLDYDLEPLAVVPPVTTFSWTIESDQVSNFCIIEVREYSDHTLNDKSGRFTISN